MPQSVSGASQSDPVFIPIGTWKPKTTIPNNDGMTFILNAVPRADGSYGPEAALSTEGSTQDTTAFGASIKVHGDLHSVGSNFGGEIRFYAGTFATSSGASRLVGRDEEGAWEDLSRPGGYDVSAFTPWRFSNFGVKILATSLGNTLQISDGGSGQFRDVSGLLRGADVATVAGFAVLVNTNDASFGEGVQPFRVWWSAIGNAESFPDPFSDTAITVQSGFRDLFGGGRLSAIVPGIGGADAIVIGERKMWRMRFVGPPQTFQFDEVETDIGTNIAGSIAPFNETFFFFGHQQFYHFDGANSNPIGADNTINEFFKEDLNTAAAVGFQTSIKASIDTENTCYVVSYRSAAATTDFNDRVLRYNWITGAWSNSVLAVDSLGNLDNFRSNTNSPRMLLIGQDFQIKTLSGSNLEATFEMHELSAADGGYTAIKALIPFVDSPDVFALLRLRDRLGSSLVDTQQYTFEADGWIRIKPEVRSGRFYRCRVRIPAGRTWTSITGVLYEFQPLAHGSRRP